MAGLWFSFGVALYTRDAGFGCNLELGMFELWFLVCLFPWLALYGLGAYAVGVVVVSVSRWRPAGFVSVGGLI